MFSFQVVFRVSVVVVRLVFSVSLVCVSCCGICLCCLLLLTHVCVSVRVRCFGVHDVRVLVSVFGSVILCWVSVVVSCVLPLFFVS